MHNGHSYLMVTKIPTASSVLIDGPLHNGYASHQEARALREKLKFSKTEVGAVYKLRQHDILYMFVNLIS